MVFSYHAILTDRDGPLLHIEADHRRHAIVEHTICDLKHHAGLAHLPSGQFAANAAGLGCVTTKTLRLTVIAVRPLGWSSAADGNACGYPHDGHGPTTSPPR